MKRFKMKIRINRMSVSKNSLLVLLGLILFRCINFNVNKAPFEINNNLNCYNNSVWTAQQIKENLIGTWKWVYTENSSSSDGKNTEDIDTRVRFDNDSVLTLLENQSTKFITKWDLVSIDTSFFEIETYTSIYQTTGRIIICDENLIFNGSYDNLSNNYFIKMD